MGEKRGSQRILVGKPEGRTILRKHRPRRKDNIDIVLREMGSDYGLDSSGSG
jgi:hypothetical protein